MKPTKKQELFQSGRYSTKACRYPRCCSEHSVHTARDGAAQAELKVNSFSPNLNSTKKKNLSSTKLPEIHTRSASSAWCTSPSLLASLLLSYHIALAHTTLRTAYTTPVETSSFFPPHIDKINPNLN